MVNIIHAAALRVNPEGKLIINKLFKLMMTALIEAESRTGKPRLLAVIPPEQAPKWLKEQLSLASVNDRVPVRVTLPRASGSAEEVITIVMARAGRIGAKDEFVVAPTTIGTWHMSGQEAANWISAEASTIIQHRAEMANELFEMKEIGSNGPVTIVPSNSLVVK